MIKSKLKKWLIGVIGSMLPFILIFTVVFAGIDAAENFFKTLTKSDNKIDLENCSNAELIKAAKNDDIITDEFLDSILMSRDSFKQLAKMIEEFNNTEKIFKKNSVTVNLNFEGSYYASREVTQEEYVTGKTQKDRDKELEEYKSLWEKTHDMAWDEYAGEETDRPPASHIVLIKSGETKKVVIDNSWLNDQYPIDWQVVALICYYDALGKDPEDNIMMTKDGLFNGDEKEARNKYIESVINEIAVTIYARNAIDKLENGKTYSQDSIKELGLPTWAININYVKEESVDGILTLTARIPKTEVTKVIDLTYIDDYTTQTGAPSYYNPEVKETPGFLQSEDDVRVWKGSTLIPTKISDTTKLVELLEKRERTLEMFLLALNSMPGGATIAKKIEYHHQIYLNEQENIPNEQ